jgi:PPOX class probable F420-dependent enzyme
VADEGPLLDLIARNREGVFATVKPDGHPQLTNIFYLWDPEERIARISTTAYRLKARNVARHPQSALHVAGGHFFSWAVAEGDATLSDVTTTPGDEVGLELLDLHARLMGPRDRDEELAQLVRDRRLIIYLKVTRVYGTHMDAPPPDNR